MTSGQPRVMRVWPVGRTLPAQGSLAVTDTANSPPLPQSIAKRTRTKQPPPNILQLRAYMDAPVCQAFNSCAVRFKIARVYPDFCGSTLLRSPEFADQGPIG